MGVRQLKVHFQDLCSSLCHTTTLLPDAEDNQEEGINTITGLWCSCCHSLLENTPCIAVVSAAQPSLECEATWFPGLKKIRRLWGQDPSPHLTSISSYNEDIRPFHLCTLWSSESVRCPETEPFLCCVQGRAGGRKLESRRPIFSCPQSMSQFQVQSGEITPRVSMPQPHPSHISLYNASSKWPSLIFLL